MSELDLNLITNLSTLAGQPIAPAKTAIPHPARAERRLICRAKICLRVRVRTADFNDGSLEHVGSTLNASRTSFFFRTPLDRYYKGMRLRITLPYDSAHQDAMEELGEVVRVDQGPGGHGVAVMRSISGNTVVVCEAPAVREERHAERRSHRRFSFVASVELTDARIGNPMQARTSDVSLSGCYIDTMNPAVPGMSVQFRIRKGDAVVEACATVLTQHPGCGMGVQFQDLTPEGSALLSSWMSEPDAPGAYSEMAASAEDTEKIAEVVGVSGKFNQPELASASRVQLID